MDWNLEKPKEDVMIGTLYLRKPKDEMTAQFHLAWLSVEKAKHISQLCPVLCVPQEKLKNMLCLTVIVYFSHISSSTVSHVKRVQVQECEHGCESVP